MTTGSTAGASADFVPVFEGFPGCGGGVGADTVYTFTVGARTRLLIALDGNGFDPVVHVRRAPCATGTQVACNDDSAGLNSRVDFVADPSSFVFVDGFNAGSEGSFTLTISTVPVNKVCPPTASTTTATDSSDCMDPDCAMDPTCVCRPTGPETSEAECSDRRDNNCNRSIDCATELQRHARVLRATRSREQRRGVHGRVQQRLRRAA